MNFFKGDVGMIVNKDLIPRRDYYNKLINNWLELYGDKRYDNRTKGEVVLIFCENIGDLFNILVDISKDNKDIKINKYFKSPNKGVIELTNEYGEVYLYLQMHNIDSISDNMRGNRGVSLILDLTEIPLSNIPMSDDIYDCVLRPLVISRTEDKPYHNVTILYYDL